jgi:hypothetical protein
MLFWAEVRAIFLGDLFASGLIFLVYILVQRFLWATDVTVGYNWKFQGTNFRPCFSFRNSSASRAYLIGNIHYTKSGRKDFIWIDNDSLWGRELRAGSVTAFNEIAPVPGVHSLQECMETAVSIHFQDGRRLRLRAQGPGQLGKQVSNRIAFWVRAKIDGSGISLE